MIFGRVYGYLVFWQLIQEDGSHFIGHMEFFMNGPWEDGSAGNAAREIQDAHNLPALPVIERFQEIRVSRETRRSMRRRWRNGEGDVSNVTVPHRQVRPNLKLVHSQSGEDQNKNGT